MRTEVSGTTVGVHDHVEGHVWASLPMGSAGGRGTLYSFVTRGAIQEGEQGVSLLPMREFHVNLGGTGHMSGSKMPPP